MSDAGKQKTKFDPAQEHAGLFEPLEVILDGTIFTVDKVTPDMITALTEEPPDGESPMDTFRKQLGVLFDVPPDNFLQSDVRHLALSVRFLTTTIMQQIANAQDSTDGNPTQPEPKGSGSSRRSSRARSRSTK